MKDILFPVTINKTHIHIANPQSKSGRKQKEKKGKLPIKEWEKVKRKERKFQIKEWEKVKKEEKRKERKFLIKETRRNVQKRSF